MWPLALVAGASFTGTAWFVAWLLGPEFPSIVGAAFSMALTIWLVRRGLLLPEQPWRFGPDDVDPPIRTRQRMSLVRAWVPYGLVASLLIVSRIGSLGLKAPLRSVRFEFRDILGTDISAALEPLYLPGSIFILVAISTVVVHRMRPTQLADAFRDSLVALVPMTIALMAAVPMIRIFIRSGVNDLGLDAMALELASLAAEATGSGWPLAAPLVGALGSFVAGSATFSNLMFAAFQSSIAADIGVARDLVLAAQIQGANAGNMVAVVNVVAALTVVGAIGQEGRVIRMTAIPMAFYVVIAGLVAFAVG